MPARLVAFSGNTGRPSRTRTLVESVVAEVSRLRAVEVRVFDLVDAGTGLCVAHRSALPLPAARIVAAIEEADALIVGSPVYKGAYSGLFKHIFDFVEPDALSGKPVVLTATGGGTRHALMVEHVLRPLFGFFSAQTMPTSVYACTAEIEDGRVIDDGVRSRITSAASELDCSLDLAARRAAAPFLSAAMG